MEVLKVSKPTWLVKCSYRSPWREEPRILQATKRLVKETEWFLFCLEILRKIKIYLEIEGIGDGYEVIGPSTLSSIWRNGCCLGRASVKGKMSEEDARKVLVEDVNYFGVMLVYLGLVDGMVSGAIHSTASTVRPALQIIKNSSKCNSYFRCLPYGSWYRTLPIWRLCHQH